jgi:hypothetical protein
MNFRSVANVARGFDLFVSNTAIATILYLTLTSDDHRAEHLGDVFDVGIVCITVPAGFRNGLALTCDRTAMFPEQAGTRLPLSR